MNTWAIGDVHGCYDQMRALLKKIPDDDQVIFLGDYVDRGPKILEVLHFIRDNRNNPRYLFLMGNHEQMMIEDSPATCYDRLTSEAIGKDDWKFWQDFLRKLPDRHETDTNYFVHGGLREDPKTVPLNEHRQSDILWTRPDYESSGHMDYGKYLIHGHTPLKQPYIGSNRANIDTGACFGRLLTAARVDSLGKIDILIQADKNDDVKSFYSGKDF